MVSRPCSVEYVIKVNRTDQLVSGETSSLAYEAHIDRHMKARGERAHR